MIETTPMDLRKQGILEEIPCPLCGQSKNETLELENYPKGLSREELLKIYHSSSDTKLMDRLVKCTACSLVYLNPRIKSEIGLESYASAEDKTFVAQNPWRIATFRRCLEQLEKWIPLKRERSTKVLDIGCAGGAFPKAASDLGYSVIGIEPSRWLCEYGRKTYSLDLRAGTLHDQHFEPESFDLITFWDVLEHVYDLQQLLKSCQRLLKPGGFLIVNYPDYNSLARKVLGKKWPFLLSVHLYYFTPKTIRKLLSDVGYSVLKITPHWQTLPLGYVLQRANAYFQVFGVVKRFVEYCGIQNWSLKYNIGQTLVISRKHAGN